VVVGGKPQPPPMRIPLRNQGLFVPLLATPVAILTTGRPASPQPLAAPFPAFLCGYAHLSAFPTPFSAGKTAHHPSPSRLASCTPQGHGTGLGGREPLAPTLPRRIPWKPREQRRWTNCAGPIPNRPVSTPRLPRSYGRPHPTFFGLFRIGSSHPRRLRPCLSGIPRGMRNPPGLVSGMRAGGGTSPQPPLKRLASQGKTQFHHPAGTPTRPHVVHLGPWRSITA
jgi:hypothetical protein